MSSGHVSSPAETGGAVPLPAGFGVALDPGTALHRRNGVITGGFPKRALRLSPAGWHAMDELLAGPVRTPAGALLARRLLALGAAHPRPPARANAADAVVIIPTRDRAELVDRCLAALVDIPAVVVDDGSRDPAAVAAVAARHGARLVARRANGGPAAARNAGLEACAGASLVIFLDSDCVPAPGWSRQLLAHFADPMVGAAAARVVPLATGGNGVLDGYAAARSPLDLGSQEALVRSGGRVSYVPTAALAVRRSALSTPAFDESLRYGEDVDAVWRMVEQGWHVRYDPSVTVGHAEPDRWPAYLRRRFRYGTSAGPLARRHPSRLAPAVLAPWPAAVPALLLARRPTAAAGAAAVSGLRLARHLRRSGLPAGLAPRLTAEAVAATTLALGRMAAQVGAPVTVAAAALPGSRRRRLIATAALLATPGVTDWFRIRPRLDPVRWVLAGLADDLAYGLGVWAGALRSRTVEPLLPRRSAPPGPGTGRHG